MRNDRNQRIKLRNVLRKIEEVDLYCVRFQLDSSADLFWARLYVERALANLDKEG